MYARNHLNAFIIIIAIVAFFVMVPGCSEDTAGPEPPAPEKGYVAALEKYGFNLSRVWSFSPGNYMALGPGNLVVKSSGGVTSPVPVPFDITLNDIWASSTANVIVVGDMESGGTYGTILRYNGHTWSQMDNTLEGNVVAVHGSAANNVYAVTSNGQVARWDGSMWLPVVDSGEILADVWTSGPNDVFLVGTAGFISYWNGTAWEEQSVAGGSFRRIWGSGPGDVYAGRQNQLYHYDGSTWSLATATSGWVEAIGGWGPDYVCVVTENQGILYFDGSVWTPLVLAGLNERLKDFHMSSGTHGVAVGDAGAVVRVDGIAWSIVHVSDDSSRDWLEVSGSSRDEVFALEIGALYHRVGAGDWTRIDAPAMHILRGLSVTAPDCVWMCAGNPAEQCARRYDGTVWHYEWATMYAPNGIWAASDDSVYIAGHNGLLVHYNGSRWTSINAVGSSFYDLWGSTGSNVYAVGQAGLVYHFDGGAWADAGPVGSATLRDIWGTSDSDIVAVGDQGTIVRYDGTEWFPEVSGVSVRLNGVWSGGPDDYWAVGETGTVLRYDGTDWSVIPLGIPGELLCVWGSGAGEVYFVGRNDCIIRYARR